LRPWLALALLLVSVARLEAAPAKPLPLVADSVAARLDSAAVVKLLGNVRNGACPLPGMATGGQPDSSTLVALAGTGLRTVLDLRAPEESRGFDEAAVARTLGLRYLTLPVTPATLADSTFDSFRALLRAEGVESIFVHCASGNRVGVVLLPWLVLDRGWSVERAMPLVDQVGLSSEELRTRALAYIEAHPVNPTPAPAQPSRKR